LSQHLWRRILVVILAIGAAITLVVLRPVRLGLDLRGGTQVVLEARDSPTRRADSDAVDRALEVLRRRVDQLGMSEPTLQRSGERRIIVELPGVVDPDEAVRVIGQTAQLTFHPVLAVSEGSGRSPSPASGRDENLILPDESGASLELGQASVTGEAVQDAQAVLDTQQLSSQWIVNVTFAGDGARRWEQLTGEAACYSVGDPRRRIAIVLDRETISSPEVSSEIQCDVGIGGDTTSITGSFTDQGAKDLALLIRAGALPVPVEIVEQRTIGPSLGEAAVRASLMAAVVGAVLTILYMVAYYRLLGAAAAVALLLYGLFSFAALAGIGATLTLPGIAGFVLAIGMAVDANVLVFERIKEEHAAGRNAGLAAFYGFKRAWSAIADSNATTLMAAVLLFFLASGAVKGFGITLTLGVVVSMFTALVVTRVLVQVLVRSSRIRARPNLLGMDVGSGFRRWLLSRGPDIIRRRRTWFAASFVVLILAVAGLVTRGLNFGLEFQGGRLMEYSTSRPVDLDAVRSELAERGLPRALVQESGSGNVLVRTGSLTSAEEASVEEAVSGLGGEVGKLRDEFIGATVSSELLWKASIALGLALSAQLLYLAVRFRWTYGSSAVVAMLHDVLILLGVFAWLGKEIDGVFVASLLTVIGYSVNDSVVVFDRIRERRSLQPSEPLATIANDACLQTIPRTINTGLGALFILLMLYVFGGDTLTDFALALLIGIAVGTYSSIFTAAPLAVTLDGLSRAAPVLSPQTRPASRKGPPVGVTSPSRAGNARRGSARGGRGSPKRKAGRRR
jgi:SecD/SecF fusion protein